MVNYTPQIEDVKKAKEKLREVVKTTPLELSQRLSQAFDAKILLKREDLQLVRSYKIRGAYNKISSLSDKERQVGVVCASAGNHAQGVALSCNKLKIEGYIYMPVGTPNQKKEAVEMFGGKNVKIVLEGDTFDDANSAAIEFAKKNNKTFVPPFDDPKVIEGQGTIGLEILEQCPEGVDYVFVPIGGGGLASGLSAVVKTLSPKTKVIGVEPLGAMSMKEAFDKKEPTKLPHIEKFVDGAAVAKAGDITYSICREFLDGLTSVPEGKVCQAILDLYNKDAIVVEPAGALTISCLDSFKEQIKGKTVVCVISGSNNDMTRAAEIKERAMLYANLKHYFIVNFSQKPGALKEFITEVLDQNSDITHFEYLKKNYRQNTSAVVGIELKNKEDFEPLVRRMKEKKFFGEYLNDKPDLFGYLV